MADNTTLNSGAGGDTISTDDLGAGVKVQRVKVQHGVDGSATDVSSASPLPVGDAGGSLTVDNPTLSVVGGGAQATALRVTLATDSPGAGTVATEDGVSVADPVGSQLIARRRDQPLPSEVSTAGDYIALNADLNGALYTRTPNRESLNNQLVATGNVDLDVTGCSTAFLQLGGGFTATIVFEGTTGASGVSAISALNLGTGALETGTSSGGSQRYMIPVGGLRTLRIRVSAYTSGTVFIDVSASAGASAVHVTDGGGALTVDGAAAADAPVSGNPVYVGARASTSTPTPVSAAGDMVPLWADTSGRLQTIAAGAHTHDSAQSSSVTGIAARAAASAPTAVDADGDAVAIRSTRRGELTVTLVDSAGTSAMDDANDSVRVSIVAGAGSGGTSMTDDAAFTPGTGGVTPAAGIYRTTRDLVDDNDAGALAMTQRRGLLTVLETTAGDPLFDDTNDHVKVGGAVAHDSANAGNVNPVLMGARGANSPLAATSTDGDATMLRSDRLGQLFVSLADSAGDSCMDGTNDAVRVNIVAGGGAGGTSMVDDAAFTPGTTAVTPVAGTYRVTRDLVDDGDAGALAMTQRRGLFVSLEDTSGNPVGTSGAPLRVDTTGATPQPIFTNDWADTDAITSNGDTATQTNVGGVGRGALSIDISGTWVATLQFEYTLNLSDWIALPVYSSLTSPATVTSATANGQWFAPNVAFQRVRVRASAYTSGTAIVKISQSLASWAPPPVAAGAAAHDAAVSGNPVLVGAEARTAVGTAVTSGDAVRVQADVFGKQVVIPGALHEEQLGPTSVNFTTTSAADLIAAQGAGIKIAVTSILVVNHHASQGTKVTVRDKTTTGKKFVGSAQPLGGGWGLASSRPLLISDANSAIEAVCGTSGADVDVTISGYLIKN